MAIPEFKSFMLPILKFLSDNQIHTLQECISVVKNEFNLDNNDMNQLIPSKKQTTVYNRVYWSLTYLKKALLIKSEQRGHYRITDRGIELLKSNPTVIDPKLLSKYPEFQDFSNASHTINNSNSTLSNSNDDSSEEDNTPEEILSNTFDKLSNPLSDELLETIFNHDPYSFEKLVMDLLTKMGYGDEKLNQVTQKTNDGGFDGIIYQDKLGLDKIYVQAKRWSNNIQRQDLQSFVGALAGINASKGVFITTSDFTNGAKAYAENQQIVLINGKSLTKYMIEYNVGVQINYSYDIKKIDNDYFDAL